MWQIKFTKAAEKDKKLLKQSEGKHPICALTHTARKILRIVWALLKTGQNYSRSISD